MVYWILWPCPCISSCKGKQNEHLVRTTNLYQLKVTDLAKGAEEAAQKGEQRNVYKVTKLICGKYNGNRNVPIRDKQGKLLTSEKDQEACWVEHFNEVLNRPPPEEEPVIPEAEEDLSVDTGPPKKEEIIAAINSLKTTRHLAKTASMLNCSRQTLWLRQAYCSHFSTPYGTEGKFLTIGIRSSSSRYQRKELCLTVTTGSVLHYYPPLARS